MNRFDSGCTSFTDDSLAAKPFKHPPYFPESAKYSKKLLVNYPDFSKNEEVICLILNTYITYGNGSIADFFNRIWPDDDPTWFYETITKCNILKFKGEKRDIIKYCQADFHYQFGKKEKASELLADQLKSCKNGLDNETTICEMIEKYLKDKF